MLAFSKPLHIFLDVATVIYAVSASSVIVTVVCPFVAFWLLGAVWKACVKICENKSRENYIPYTHAHFCKEIAVAFGASVAGFVGFCLLFLLRFATNKKTNSRRRASGREARSLDGVCTEDERLANKLEPVRGADLDSLARQANHIHQ